MWWLFEGDEDDSYSAWAFITEGVRRKHHGAKVGRSVGDVEMVEFASGGKSSERKPQYHLIPIEGLQYAAERLGMGAASHGTHNYKRGVEDAEFIADRQNHMLEHCLYYLQGSTTTDKRGRVDTPKDHLKAVIANAMMLAYIEENREPE